MDSPFRVSAQARRLTGATLAPEAFVDHDHQFVATEAFGLAGDRAGDCRALIAPAVEAEAQPQADARGLEVRQADG